jgi:hypothetical protein
MKPCRLLWFLLSFQSLASLPAGQAQPPPAVTGTIECPNITGAAALSNGRLLLTRDGANGVLLIPDAAARFATGTVVPTETERLQSQLVGKTDLDDLQDAAPDGAGGAYLLASHARTRFGDAPEARYRLSRLRFDAAGKLVDARQSGALVESITRELPFLGDSVRRPPAKAGLCLEGLAVGPQGELLIGVRSPTVTESRPRPHGGQEDAVVVPVRNPAELFAAPAKPVRFGEVVKLDLHGQGIRGLCYDPGRKGYWLLSGLSVQPGHPVKSAWSLWFWDGTSSPREVPLPPGTALESPGAICLLGTGASSRLLLIDGMAEKSSYVLLAPRVPTAPPLPLRPPSSPASAPRPKTRNPLQTAASVNDMRSQNPTTPSVPPVPSGSLRPFRPRPNAQRPTPNPPEGPGRESPRPGAIACQSLHDDVEHR